MQFLPPPEKGRNEKGCLFLDSTELFSSHLSGMNFSGSVQYLGWRCRRKIGIIMRVFLGIIFPFQFSVLALYLKIMPAGLVSRKHSFMKAKKYSIFSTVTKSICSSDTACLSMSCNTFSCTSGCLARK